MLCQSLNCLSSGLFPERSIFNCGAHLGEPSDLDAGMCGQPLRNGGHIGFLFCTCADLDAATGHRNLPHCGSHRFCHRCDAGQLETALNFLDRRPSAPRLRTIKAGCAHMFAAHVLSTSIMHLCVASYLGDYMHTMYSGVWAAVNGSVLAYILDYGGLDGATGAARMKSLWVKIQQAYESLGIPAHDQIGRLTVDMFLHDGDFAELRQVRAHEQKSLLPVVAEVLCSCSLTSTFAETMTDLLDLLYDIDMLIRKEGFWLSADGVVNSFLGLEYL